MSNVVEVGPVITKIEGKVIRGYLANVTAVIKKDEADQTVVDQEIKKIEFEFNASENFCTVSTDNGRTAYDVGVMIRKIGYPNLIKVKYLDDNMLSL